MRLRGMWMLSLVAASCASFDAAPSASPDDAAAPDASPDAGVDGAPPSEEHVPRPTVGSCGWPTLDDDFERSPILGSSWDEVHVDGPGGINLSTSTEHATSGMRSLLVDVTAGTSADRANVLRKALPSFTPPKACIQVHAFLRVESVTGSTRPIEISLAGGNKLLYVKLDKGVSRDAVLVLREQSLVVDASSPLKDIAQADVSFGRWYDVGITLALGTTPAAILSIDETPAQPLSMLGSIVSADAPTMVTVGCAYTTTASARYFIDDVSIR